MENIKCANKITIDFDTDTVILLRGILNGAITRSVESGIPIDPKYYSSIEKLKTISELSGTMTIKLPNSIQLDADRMKYKGIKEVEEV